MANPETPSWPNRGNGTRSWRCKKARFLMSLSMRVILRRIPTKFLPSTWSPKTFPSSPRAGSASFLWNRRNELRLDRKFNCGSCRWASPNRGKSPFKRWRAFRATPVGHTFWTLPRKVRSRFGDIGMNFGPPPTEALGWSIESNSYLRADF